MELRSKLLPPRSAGSVQEMIACFVTVHPLPAMMPMWMSV
jgi:hypothetical protein